MNRQKDAEMLAHLDMAQATVDDLLDALKEYWDGDMEITLESGRARITMQADVIGTMVFAVKQKIVETIKERTAYEAQLQSRGVKVCRPA